MEKDEKLNQFDNSWPAVWKRKIAELQDMLKKKDLYSSWQVAQIEGEIKNLQEKIKKNEALKNGKSKVEKIGKEAENQQQLNPEMMQKLMPERGE